MKTKFVSYFVRNSEIPRWIDSQRRIDKTFSRGKYFFLGFIYDNVFVNHFIIRCRGTLTHEETPINLYQILKSLGVNKTTTFRCIQVIIPTDAGKRNKKKKMGKKKEKLFGLRMKNVFRTSLKMKIFTKTRSSRYYIHQV